MLGAPGGYWRVCCGETLISPVPGLAAAWRREGEEGEGESESKEGKKSGKEGGCEGGGGGREMEEGERREGEGEGERQEAVQGGREAGGQDQKEGRPQQSRPSQQEKRTGSAVGKQGVTEGGWHPGCPPASPAPTSLRNRQPAAGVGPASPQLPAPPTVFRVTAGALVLCRGEAQLAVGPYTLGVADLWDQQSVVSSPISHGLGWVVTAQVCGA